MSKSLKLAAVCLLAGASLHSASSTFSGARVCDPQLFGTHGKCEKELCALDFAHCCGSQTRAPLNIDTAPALGIDYFEPKLLSGVIYDTAEGSNRVLFTFRRTATQSNSTVSVLRE